MNTPPGRWVGWLAFAALILGTIAVGLQVGALERNPDVASAALKLLGTYGVIALVVERTLEVFISAWRGRVTGQLFVAVESARRRLEAAPHAFSRQQAVEAHERSLTDYRAQTQRIALRAGVVLGLLISAIGVRTLDIIVAMPPSGGLPHFLFTIIDMAITAGMIGGGSDAVHKLMKAVTGFLDATRSQHAKLTTDDPRSLGTLTGIPSVTPGPPVDEG